MISFNQQDYNTLVNSLDAAFAVFVEKSTDPEAALKDFVVNHYLRVWRKMTPPVSRPDRVGRLFSDVGEQEPEKILDGDDIAHPRPNGETR